MLFEPPIKFIRRNAESLVLLNPLNLRITIFFINALGIIRLLEKRVQRNGLVSFCEQDAFINPGMVGGFRAALPTLL